MKKRNATAKNKALKSPEMNKSRSLADRDTGPAQLSLLDLTGPMYHGELMDEAEFKSLLKNLLPEPAEIVLTRNRSSLIWMQTMDHGGRVARVQHCFRAADQKTIKALARFLVRPDKRNRERIDAFLREHAELVEAMGREPQAPPSPVPRGQHHDLNKAMRKVMRDYGLKVPGLGITWSSRGPRRRRRSIKFGSFCKDSRMIRVHPDLDSPRVPDYFIEYIVYHEILHALFPPSDEDGRREVHGPEFKRFERKFERFEEALRFETEFVEKMLK